MSAHSLSSAPAAGRERPAPAWMYARPLWAGLSIVAMWLAVLFVGIFGGDIRSASASGSASSVPVVVVVAGVALFATIAVARRAFHPEAADDELRAAIENERREREELAREVSDLRDRISAGAGD